MYFELLSQFKKIVLIIVSLYYSFIGIVDKLLSFKGWIPLSRLTYGAYLLNPVIIRAIYSSNEKSIHFEFVSIVSIRTNIIFKVLAY